MNDDDWREHSDKPLERPELPWDDSYGDHIRIIDGLFDDNICRDCIETFDDLEQRGLTHTRRSFGSHNMQRSDTSIFHTELDPMVHAPMQKIGDYISDTIIESWQIKYPVIESGAYYGLYLANMKMQKTRPSEGYHNWHFEGGVARYDRQSVLGFMVYLNDIEDGGETEFLYQGKRVNPVQGRFVCWPSGFTHVHRGNPPLQETKYAITGWINYLM